ncbi:MAG: DEAD/DEAH box helicase [Bacteroidetes bacterium]|nr:DEAD/DEAH box helicase [Bacteroidota bacterium]
MGFEQATPIQEQAFPIILDGRDLIGCAQTGTGKTAAFLLPVLDDLVMEPADHITTLILVPTRELALQIDQALQGFSYYTPVSSLPIYGGTDGIAFEREKKALTQGANVIIATPGRLLAHMNMGYVNFKNLRHLILDEADRMLHMGFIFDIQKIVSYLPAERQTLMFSATMSPKIRDLAKKLLRNPEEISLAVSKPAERVKQMVYLVEDSSKNALIRSIVLERKGVSTIIFAGTKQKVKDLERELYRSGLQVGCIHSDLEQLQREEVLRGFRSKRVPVLVATDILSRGIDIDDIGLVINYDVPRDGEDYVHRIGRTARAASEGEAITLVNSPDRRKLKRIEELIESSIMEMPLPEGIQMGVTEKKPGRDRPGRPGKNSGKSGHGKERKGNPRR